MKNKISSRKIAVLSLVIILLSLLGCGKKQRVYFIGDQFENSLITATVLSADTKESININGEAIDAPVGSMYIIVEMEASINDGSQEQLSDIILYIDNLDKLSFNKELTSKANGVDNIDFNSLLKQRFTLIYVVEKDDISLSSCSIKMEFDGHELGGPFILIEGK